MDTAVSPALSLPTYIDSSMLSTWRSCRRKFFWSHLNALYPSGKSVHLIAGGAFAAGMEAARRLAFSNPGGRRPTHDDLLEAAFRAFAREWGDYESPEDSPKSLINTFEALAWYLKKYPPEEDIVKPLIRADGSPAVEYTFSIPIEEGPRHPETGDPFLFVGRFDLLGSYNGLPCIQDEKTTGGLGFAWMNQWKLRGQFMGYCWACQQTGHAVNHAVIRGIAILKGDYKDAVVIEQYPQFLVERWYQQLLYDLNDMCSAWHGFKYAGEPSDLWYPYNFADACSSYGGCAFDTLCAAKDPEPFFSNYVRHRWNPLNKQPVEEL
jgi:PD-(D/E)XK nuclease superfamily